MSLAGVRNLLSQWFPPQPTYTEQHVPSQKGKVFIVTGGNHGIGFELVKILYATGAKIYMASRSKVGLHSNLDTFELKKTADVRYHCMPVDLQDFLALLRHRSSSIYLNLVLF